MKLEVRRKKMSRRRTMSVIPARLISVIGSREGEKSRDMEGGPVGKEQARAEDGASGYPTVSLR
jgi:hypothetical protein